MRGDDIDLGAGTVRIVGTIIGRELRVCKMSLITSSPVFPSSVGKVPSG
ncbi:hypothetical protein [Nocardia goodfellowii]|uniref:Uncharacterized protein n=1 Tax=Nocardia goodfellowii TaxID=882446 RepID=A0ABS4QH30_9NOCA|nr:hypothetical protein [Nocardia goodfellowii]MBP2191016.1 hypothetical protein [Nocardia goodfellowii]